MGALPHAASTQTGAAEGGIITANATADIPALRDGQATVTSAGRPFPASFQAPFHVSRTLGW